MSATDAEDLAQSFMADVPRKLHTYRLVNDDGEPNRFRSWLKAVVERMVIDFRRAIKSRTADHAPGGRGPLDRMTAALSAAAASEMADELATAFEHDIAAAVEAVKRRVRPETWAAYERYELLGEAIEGVARSLGKTVGAVFVAVNRVNRMLAETGAFLAANGTATDMKDCHEPLPQRRGALPLRR